MFKKEYIKEKLGKNHYAITSGASDIIFNATLSGNQFALHHIISHCTTKELIKNLDRSGQRDRLRDELNNYINLEHIKPLVNNAIAYRDDTNNKKKLDSCNDGHILSAAISWNPHNLVPGPLPENRTDDCANDLDRPIYDAQANFDGTKSEYQISVDNFFVEPSISNYGKIPKILNDVKYELANPDKPQDKKFKVKKI